MARPEFMGVPAKRPYIMSISVFKIKDAVKLLKKGEVIAYPTETVYGLGADATNSKAVQKIFDLKGRSDQSPISVLIASLEQLPEYVKPFPMRAQELIDRFWPGPLTLVFEAQENVFPGDLLAGSGKIGIRMSSDPIAQELCKEFGLPLTTTSANPSGKLPAHSLEEVGLYFSKSSLKACIEGGKRQSKEVSTVLDVTSEPFKILRQGKISAPQLKGYL